MKLLHKITSLSGIYTWYFLKKIQCAYCGVYMFYLKTKCSSVIGPQSTNQQVDRMLDIQRIEQSLVEAMHTIVLDQENIFMVLKKDWIIQQIQL